MSKLNSKYYNWECVVWEESLPNIKMISDFGVRGFLSPLHNLDGGQPHYHWIMIFNRQVSYESLMNMLMEEGFENCINTVKYIKDLPTRVRYLIHLDNPEKAQYDSSQVRCYGGVSFESYINEASDKFDDDTSLFDVIKKYNCTSFAQLVRYCSVVNRSQYKSVVGRCGFWSAYMRSLSNDSISWEMENIINEKRGIKE